MTCYADRMPPYSAKILRTPLLGWAPTLQAPTREGGPIVLADVALVHQLLARAASFAGDLTNWTRNELEIGKVTVCSGLSRVATFQVCQERKGVDEIAARGVQLHP